MARRSSSPRMVGRDAELAALLSAVLGNDADRPVILIAGEAGIGKTRLLGELARRLAAPFPGGGGGLDRPVRIVRGSCLQLGDGELPFAPVLEIIDGLRDRADLAARIGPLRAGISGADSQPSAGSSGGGTIARAGRFIEIYDLLVAAADPDGLVVAVDDLHWADQSTLDLALFLARRLRNTRVRLVLAYRSDELHRRHPLRPVLAELNRGFVRERLELGPLDADAVADQIRDLRGETTPELSRRVLQRADGNPFHVEELVSLDLDARSLPDSLRDVLLARVTNLDSDVHRVLAAAAVLGRPVDATLLSLLVDLDDAAIADAVAGAVDRAILTPSDDRGAYRFRHALLAEAVSEDLLPATRVSLHRRVARVLRDRPELLPEAPAVAAAELALHLDRGGEAEEAIDAYLEATRSAFRALAWSEGSHAYQRAADLVARGRPPGDQEHLDARLAELVEPVALALDWTGAGPAAIALLRDSVAKTQGAGDASAAAHLSLVLSRILNDLGDEAGSREAARVAAGLHPPDPTTFVGIEMQIALASAAWMAGHNGAGLAFAEQAVQGAEGVGDAEILLQALVHRAETLIGLGRLDDGWADYQRTQDLLRERGGIDLFGQATTNVGISLTQAGVLDRAIEVWREGLRQGRELGVGQSWDPWNLAGLAYWGYLTGFWGEADEAIATARSHAAAGTPVMYREMGAALLAAGRGDLDGFDESLDIARANARDLLGDVPVMLAHASAARAVADGDAVARLAAIDEGLRMLEGTDLVMLWSGSAADGASAAADLAEAMRKGRDDEALAGTRGRADAFARLAADVDESRFVQEAVSVPLTKANAMWAAAEASRANGMDDPDAWPPIASAFEGIGMRPKVAETWYRCAIARLGAGDRSGAAAALAVAQLLADDIGMVVLLRRITVVARAGRLDIERAGGQPASPSRQLKRARPDDGSGLSAREREVLELVAAGRTNAEIGQALFISSKTASVHVTHILDKLGVSSRTEAALLATRARLID